MRKEREKEGKEREEKGEEEGETKEENYVLFPLMVGNKLLPRDLGTLATRKRSNI